MKQIKMLFPKAMIGNDNIQYEKGGVYDIADTPGSIDRWLLRGCKIVEEKPAETVIEEKEVEIVEEKPVKRSNKKTSRRK